MNEQQIQDIADRIIAALENMAPGGPGWWVFAAPITVFLAALVAAVVGGLNLRKQQQALEQRSKADARAEWWKRVQWALEATVSEDEVMQDYGDAIIRVLAKSDLAGKEERLMFDAVWQDSDTELQDDRMDELVEEVLEEQDETREFTERLVAQMQKFLKLSVDDSPGTGDNGGKKEEPDA